MLIGELVELHAIEREDLPQMQEWRNDPKLRKNFREYRELSADQQELWYQQAVLGDQNSIMYSIKMKSNKELIGCAGFNHVNWIHRRGEVSLYIGRNRDYIDDQGLAKDALNLLLAFGFRELGLQRIWTETYEFDDKKRDLTKQVGFSEDGRLRANYFYEGRWWDSLVISIIAADYINMSK
jgi:RimJ/RimL family protein N-acetyltransferase